MTNIAELTVPVLHHVYPVANYGYHWHLCIVFYF